MHALLVLCLSAAAAANVTIVATGAAEETAPAWFLAAREADLIVRARERAEDRAAVQLTLSDMQQNLSFIQQTLSDMQQNLSSVQQTLSEVADAVVTRAVAERVDLCAPSTALLIFVERSQKTFTHGSAVPMFSAAGGTNSSYFLTSAHLFVGVTGPVTVFFSGTEHSCALAATFDDGPTPLDAAIVYCASGIAVPPSTPSAMAYRPHLSAAMLGFSDGNHMQPGLCNTKLVENGTRHSIAPHVRFTRLASSMQTPHPVRHSGSTASQGDFTYTKPASTPPVALETAVGFMDSSPEVGMSGGAVVDMHCGLLGIIKCRSMLGVGGELVRLTQPVMDRVLEAIAQHKLQGSTPVRQ